MSPRDYRIRAVCYGTDGRHTTRKMVPCLRELEALLQKLPGVEVAAWTMDKLMQTMYWTAHKKLATGPTCGHKSWKAYIVMRELLNVDEGDVVLYLDADIRWRPGVDLLARFVDVAKERGIVLRRSRFKNREFTQRDTFVCMGMNEEKYWKAPQVFGGMLAFERGNRALRFVHDWLVASLSYDVITAKKSTRGKEFPTFCAHRREQSILSTLAVHYDVELYQADDVFVHKNRCGAEPPGYEARE